MSESRETDPSPAPIDKLLAAAVARRFYLENQSKVDIAKAFNISRFKVARLLDAALAHDIVRIDITVPAEIDVPLSQALTERFGLRHAVVVNLTSGEGGVPAVGDAQQVSRWLGTAAAQLISEIIEGDDVLGLDGSRSVEALSEAVARLPSCDVVQLTGVHGQDLANDTVVAAVRRTAEAGGGRAFPLYAPFALPNAQTASILRSQPAIAGTLDRFGRVTKAVVGVRAWEADRSPVYEALTDQEREMYRASGACAEVAGQLFDAAGQAVPMRLNARTIAISAAELRRVPEVIGVSGGERNAGAIRAVVRSGLLTGVVTDATTARRLLGDEGVDEGADDVSRARGAKVVEAAG
ncbi:sugar-binding transcriptional regulator [Streptomyces spongiae]|uniref:Transcriptional regulator n=1 Tax=Streptomyces spongiae TaxID=565072 RepID=A0A5N8XFU7_9ACTN|nr:sugar-binding domain-containing protein [Streptomyces spongiae]MPY57828.1 transcriptional regulator [Streptomyces spongiae]